MTFSDALRSKMYLAGILTYDPIIPDGRLHRIHVDGDRKGTKNGWYILYADYPAVGIFGCWKRHICLKWQPYRDTILSTSSLIALYERRRNMQARYVQEFQPELDALYQSEEIWNYARPATACHGYLVRKGVRSYGLRYHQGALLIPVTDSSGQFFGMQRIWRNGAKRFCKGTTKTGKYFIIGTPVDNIMLVCEGYSTAATLHEISGHAVVVAFDSGNLTHVAKSLRVTSPNIRLVFCADDDHADPENPGLRSAFAAAQIANGELMTPIFFGARGPGDTDFNDYKRPPKQKRNPIGLEKLFQARPDERTLPYFEIVPEQVFSDQRYDKLSRHDQGDFLRFVILLWQERCRHIRHQGVIAQNLGMEQAEWENLEKRLVEVGLLLISSDGNYIIQQELREQYLQTLETNNNMRRCKR
jgi:putative DNA primase/helicase